MPEIYSVTPTRGRAGQELVITGAGFAPASPFGNVVEIGGAVCVISAESEFEITADIPAVADFAAENEWAILTVSRGDTAESAVAFFWAKGLIATFPGYAIPEAIPGALEQVDLDADNPRTLTAKTWRRLVTLAEYLGGDAQQGKGGLLVRDSVGVAGVAPGADGDVLLAHDEKGARFERRVRRLTLRWGKQVDAGATNNGRAVANGPMSDQTTTQEAGELVAPFACVIRRVWVFVDSATGGDTLDQVQVHDGTSAIYDSGAGLAVAANAAHQAAPDLVVAAGTTLNLLLYKSGTAGTMDLAGLLELEEAAAGEESDAAVVSDSVTGDVYTSGDASDTAAVTDSLAVVHDQHRLPSDASLLADDLEVVLLLGGAGADALDVTDSVDGGLL